MNLGIYDLQNNDWTNEDKLGLSGQASYERLVQIFRDAGEIKFNENITQFKFTDKVIVFRIERIADK